MDVLAVALIALGGAIVGAAITWFAARDAAQIQVRAAQQIARDNAERAAREFHVRGMRQAAVDLARDIALCEGAVSRNDHLRVADVFREASARRTADRRAIIGAPVDSEVRLAAEAFIEVENNFLAEFPVQVGIHRGDLQPVEPLLQHHKDRVHAAVIRLLHAADAYVIG